MNEEMRAAFEYWCFNDTTESANFSTHRNRLLDCSSEQTDGAWHAWQHQQAKIDVLEAKRQGALDSLREHMQIANDLKAEIERLRQPVSDEQIEKILDVNMQWVAFRPKFTIERRNSEMRSILERK